MPRYVVNNRAQDNGDHEVHRDDCKKMPQSYIDLGNHSSCGTAVTEAKRHCRQSNGCAFCSPACHTS